MITEDEIATMLSRIRSTSSKNRHLSMKFQRNKLKLLEKDQILEYNNINRINQDHLNNNRTDDCINDSSG